MPEAPAGYLPLGFPKSFKIDGAIEAESLVKAAAATEGTVWRKDQDAYRGIWSDDALLAWNPTTVGAKLQILLPAPADGTYDLAAYFGQFDYSGRIRILLGGLQVGPELDLFAASPRPTGSVDFGDVQLRTGDNAMTVEVIGRTDGVFCGVDIDAFVLTPRNLVLPGHGGH